MGFIPAIVAAGSAVAGALGAGKSDYKASGAQLNEAPVFEAFNALRGPGNVDQNLLNTGAADATGANQKTFAQMLMERFSGQGPSVAEQQLARATDANIAGTAGAIGSVRGINPALAARMILNNQAGVQQQAAGQAAELRAGEMLNTSNTLAQALAQQRQQDLATATEKGNFGLNTLNSATNRATAMGQLGNQANQNRVSNQSQQNSAQAGIEAGNSQMKGGIIGGALQGVGAALGMADGGEVPGEAEEAGDDPDNDKVPALLSPKEIVLPRSVTMAEDAPEKAAEFVRALKSRKKKASDEDGYARVARARSFLEKGLKALGEA